MMAGQARSSAEIMGLDTHMILEAVVGRRSLYATADTATWTLRLAASRPHALAFRPDSGTTSASQVVERYREVPSLPGKPATAYCVSVWSTPGILEAVKPGRMQGHGRTEEVSR
jgi:hypothetical protein